MVNTNKLMQFYRSLAEHYGPQHWWPGDSPFEIAVGAILTQNTNWKNVEKAIANLKKAGMLDPQKINSLTQPQLAELIKPAGYFNIKAKRLKNFIHWLCQQYQADMTLLQRLSTESLRQELLAINGIGPETADSIVLYALEKPTFVVDTYTYRILLRHMCIEPEAQYPELKEYCQSQLPDDTKIYNELHALIVRVGKEHCKPKPKCQNCPLNNFPHCTEPDDYF